MNNNDYLPFLDALFSNDYIMIDSIIHSFQFPVFVYGNTKNNDKLEDSTVEKLLNGEELVEGLGGGSGKGTDSLDLR